MIILGLNKFIRGLFPDKLKSINVDNIDDILEDRNNFNPPSIILLSTVNNPPLPILSYAYQLSVKLLYFNSYVRII
jgi:hypothetical protein